MKKIWLVVFLLIGVQLFLGNDVYAENNEVKASAKVFPNGDVFTPNNDNNALIEDTLYYAACAQYTNTSNFVGFMVPGSGVGPVNTSIVDRIRDELNKKTINLDYGSSSVSVEVPVYTRTAVVGYSKVGEYWDYYVDWKPKKSGELKMQTPGVTGSYTYSSISGSGASQMFKYTFTFKQTTNELKGNKIDFTFSPEMDVSIDEYFRPDGSMKRRTGSYQFAGFSLSVNRTGKDVTITPVPQTLKYGNEDTQYNAKDFVKITDSGGTVLNDLDVSFTKSPNALEETPATVKVTKSNVNLGEYTVPITYEYGNSLNVLAIGDGRVATFSLNDSLSTITGTYDYNLNSDEIHPYFPDEKYYEFTHYWKSTISKGPLNKQVPNVSFTALGNDRVDLLNNFGTNRKIPVSKGDVIGIYHAEPEERLQNFSDSVLQTTPDATITNNLYQITDTGFELLGLNRLTTSKQTIDLMTSNTELDANVAKYLDTTKYPSVKAVKFTEYPDTSKAGISTGKILVEESLVTGDKAQYEYEVSFNIDDSKVVNVTPVPQVLKYGNESTQYNAKDFVKITNSKGEVLNGFDVDFVKFPDSLKDTAAVVKVTNSNTDLGEYTVPVSYEYGNSLNILSVYDKRSATFSLNDSLTMITGTYDYGKSSEEIHSYFADEKYYEFTHYWKSTISKGALNEQTPNVKFTALGSDRVDILNNFGTDRKIPVSKGDIVGIYHAEPKNRLQNFSDSVLQTTLDPTITNNLYQITDSGFELLGLNRLMPSEQTIDLMTSKTELDTNITKYLDTTKYPNVKVVKFTEYPDTSKAGVSTGKILVEEPLVTGDKAQYEYKVEFNIDDSKVINITFPTKVVFWSADSTLDSPDNNDNAILKSKEYNIVNNSKRPVKVSISNYNTKNNVAGIKNLQLNIGNQNLYIVTDTKDTSANLAGTSFKLDRVTNDILSEDSSTKLSLSGETDLNVFDPDKTKSLTHILELEVQILDEQGN